MSRDRGLANSASLVPSSVVNSNTLNLDPDPEVWPSLDPDPKNVDKF